MAQLRAKVPPLEDDRYTAPDIEAASALISRGDIAGCTHVAMPELSA
jgi:histidine ammonia-lyase